MFHFILHSIFHFVSLHVSYLNVRQAGEKVQPSPDPLVRPCPTHLTCPLTNITGQLQIVHQTNMTKSTAVRICDL